MSKIKNKKTEKFKSSQFWRSYVLIILLFSCIYLPMKAQTIAPYFFGSNAWMPDSIGTHKWYGTLANHWQDVKASHCVSVRIGGNGYDQKTSSGGPPTTHQLLVLIDSIQVNGGEPMVQIDYADGDTTNGALTSTQAGALVTAINVTYLSSIQRKVKYWIIGNEPDKFYTNPRNTAAGMAIYIKAFAAKMKTADTTISIIAPELSSYNPGSTGILASLLTYGGGNDITRQVPSHSYYYVDYISFHYYPFDSTQTRANVISKITSTGGFKDNLDSLTAKLTSPNSHRSSNPIKIAITEGNINWRNPSDKTVTGLSACSYIAGQFWAEMMEYCMQKNVQFLNFWSVIEGSDLGFLRNSNGSKRPTWFNFSLVSENFKGTFLPNLYTGDSITYKAFAYKNTIANEIGVIVMNQNIQSPRGTDTTTNTFSINFNNAVPDAANMKFKFAATNAVIGTSGTYNCSIRKESTLLLVFDITTGGLKKRETYSLQDALRTTDTGTLTYITDSTVYSNHISSSVSSSIVIGTGTSITAGTPKVFKATNSITINGPFSSGTSALTLEVVQACP